MNNDFENSEVQNENTSKHWQLALKFGCIYALIQICLVLLFYILGMNKPENSNAWITTPPSFIASIAILLIALKSRRDEQLNGCLSYGQSVGTGSFVLLFASIIMGIWTWFYMTYLDSETAAFAMQEAKRSMIERGMSDDEMNQALEISKNFMTPIAMSFYSIFGTMLFGFILVLIISIFTKRESQISS